MGAIVVFTILSQKVFTLFFSPKFIIKKIYFNFFITKKFPIFRASQPYFPPSFKINILPPLAYFIVRHQISHLNFSQHFLNSTIIKNFYFIFAGIPLIKIEYCPLWLISLLIIESYIKSY